MQHDPARPALARPRPLHPLQRPRQHPAVLAAVPRRLRPRARRHQAVPPVGFGHAGPPRGRPHRRRRGHHRPTRPGLRQRRRHGHRRASPARRSSAPTCSTTTRSSSPATAASWRASATRPRRSPATSGSVGSCASTTTTTSPSTATPNLTYSDDVGKRFEAYGWHVEHLGEIADDLRRARGRAAPCDGRHRPAEPARSCARTSPCPAPTSPTSTRRTATRSPPSRSARTKAVMGIPDEPFWAPAELVAAYRAHCAARGAAGAGRVAAALRRERRRPCRVGRLLGRHGHRRLGGRAADVRAGREDRHPRGDREGVQRLARHGARAWSPAPPTSPATPAPSSPARRR